MKSEHWVFLDEAEETKFVRYGGAVSQASEDHPHNVRKMARSVQLRKSIGGSSARLAPLSFLSTDQPTIGSPKFGDSIMNQSTFSKKPKDQEEVMYDAVMEHMEEDDEDLPDTLVSRLTRVIHDQKCVGQGISPIA